MGMPRAAMVRAMVCSALWLTMATCHRGVGTPPARSTFLVAGLVDGCMWLSDI